MVEIMSTVRRKYNEIKDVRRAEDHMQDFLVAKNKIWQMLKDHNEKRVNVPNKGSFKGYNSIFTIKPTHIDKPKQNKELIIQGSNKCFSSELSSIHYEKNLVNINNKRNTRNNTLMEFNSNKQSTCLMK